MLASAQFTSSDLELLPDIPGLRYEIIDGELYVSKTPHEHHQYAVAAIVSALHTWSTQTSRGVTLAGPGLVFAPDQDVIPDVVWVSRERRSRILDDRGHFRAAPELVVEVLSPGRENERRDRELKLNLYSRQGVDEYWILDWQGRAVEVYLRQAGSLRLTATLADDDVLTSPLLPGFACAVASLWAPPLDEAPQVPGAGSQAPGT